MERPLIRVVVRRLGAAADDLAASVPLLDAAERRRAASYADPDDSARFAAGRAELRGLLAGSTGVAPGDVPLVEVEGRPVLAVAMRGTAADGPGGPVASVAHAAGLVIAAVAPRGRLGVDVEPVDAPVSREERLAIGRDVLGLGGDELAAFAQEDDRAAALAFLRRWTLTEAVLKALGTGFAADARRVRIDAAAGVPRLLGAPGLAGTEPAGWTLRMLPLGPGHVGALATDLPEPRLALDGPGWAEEIRAGTAEA